MRKTVTILFAAIVLTAVSSLAQATAIDDVDSYILQARAYLLAMMDATNKAALDKQGTFVTEATQKADAALVTAMADPAQTTNAAKLKEFQSVWDQFKATRDQEIIPALYADDLAKAKGLASGIQTDRFKKMTGLLNELRKK
ncbi:MAG: hypothetical protein RKO66_00440 [Candidatus Contendobacter sp.]|nr:hypothetical protein [Candidatus Contendobacter sp.]MDS4057824.1 hypothetical protein [Candidatus Contendobacter sp.]